MSYFESLLAMKGRKRKHTVPQLLPGSFEFKRRWSSVFRRLVKDILEMALPVLHATIKYRR